jgi:4-diphosphocytidyl-2C-methyl-D-erythritol kinase
MNAAKVYSYGKINLSLDILGEEGGYHSIDSVVVTIDICDVIKISKRKKDKLVTITMHGMGSESIPFDENNAVKAAQAFIAQFDTCGVDITIFKNIPIGAGLGGSSADIAGVLNCMGKLFEIDDSLKIKDIADSLGSDCGYMLTGGYARIYGRGQLVQPIESALPLSLVLLIPNAPVSTAQCYKTYDKINVKPKPATQNVLLALAQNDVAALGKALGNSLLAPAICLNESIGNAKKQLQEFSPCGVSMTGSGSAVFAVCESEEFARYIVSRYRGECKIIQAKTHLPKREDK